MPNETESLDALVVQISADLQPLFSQLDAAVKMLKERVKAMQGDANIPIGADSKNLLNVLNQVQGKSSSAHPRPAIQQPSKCKQIQVDLAVHSSLLIA
jgi:hypothetical protein